MSRHLWDVFGAADAQQQQDGETAQERNLTRPMWAGLGIPPPSTGSGVYGPVSRDSEGLEGEMTDWEEALWRNQGFSQVAVVPTVYRLAWLLGVRDYMEEEHRSST